MYVSLHFPFAPQYFPQKKHGFSSVFAKRTSKNIEFFQIFGKRMQEAQASKKAGRGNRAWDPCFATPAPRRLRLVERHQIAARYVGTPPPTPKTYVIDVGRGGVRGGVILYIKEAVFFSLFLVIAASWHPAVVPRKPHPLWTTEAFQNEVVLLQQLRDRDSVIQAEGGWVSGNTHTLLEGYFTNPCPPTPRTDRDQFMETSALQICAG